MHAFYTKRPRSGHCEKGEKVIRVATWDARDLAPLFERLMISRNAREVKISTPPKDKAAFRSKTKPVITVPENMERELRRVGVAEIPKEYFDVVTAHLKADFYEKYSGFPMTDLVMMEPRYAPGTTVRKYFDQKIRGELIQLLMSGMWVDEPEYQGGNEGEALKFLNSQFEKIDLGRRKHLNFSSEQGEVPVLGVNKHSEKHRFKQILRTYPQVEEYLRSNVAKKEEFHRNGYFRMRYKMAQSAAVNEGLLGYLPPLPDDLEDGSQG